MKYSHLLAAVLVCTSSASIASSGFSSPLNEGVNTIVINAPIGTVFNEEITFSLSKSSGVTGTISTLTGDVKLSDLRIQRYSETGNMPLIGATTSNEEGVATFNLGQLWVPTEIGFESGLYTLFMSGLKTSNTTALNLSLNVTPVPEPTSWTLLGMGLAGLVSLHRSKFKKTAES